MTNANSDDSLMSHPIWYISNSGKDNCTYADLELAPSVILSSFAKNCLSSGTSGWPDSVETNKDDLLQTSTFHPRVIGRSWNSVTLKQVTLGCHVHWCCKC